MDNVLGSASEIIVFRSGLVSGLWMSQLRVGQRWDWVQYMLRRWHVHELCGTGLISMDRRLYEIYTWSGFEKYDYGEWRWFM
jgi:hypothetical protein